MDWLSTQASTYTFINHSKSEMQQENGTEDEIFRATHKPVCAPCQQWPQRISLPWQHGLLDLDQPLQAPSGTSPSGEMGI
eukprot:m.42212 g.42212  ORF g.42212 m.42212 type:complete len:80 (+) comp11903_c0_seq1:1697-1936(+)